MTEPPRRKRFQIHLSTAIVMMFVAGALIWANVSRRDVKSGYVSESEFIDHGDALRGWRAFYFGWPDNICYSESPLVMNRIGEIIRIGSAIKTWHGEAIILNTFVGVSILFAVWFLCEWLARRRAARKGA